MDVVCLRKKATFDVSLTVMMEVNSYPDWYGSRHVFSVPPKILICRNMFRGLTM